VPELDLVDFRCSAAWLNYYHARGYTPRFDLSTEIHTLKDLDESIRKLKVERSRVMVRDEEWFEKQTTNGSLQRMLDKKQEEIQALRNELITLHRKNIQMSHETEHRGIKSTD